MANSAPDSFLFLINCILYPVHNCFVNYFLQWVEFNRVCDLIKERKRSVERGKKEKEIMMLTEFYGVQVGV